MLFKMVGIILHYLNTLTYHYWEIIIQMVVTDLEVTQNIENDINITEALVLDTRIL